MILEDEDPLDAARGARGLEPAREGRAHDRRARAAVGDERRDRLGAELGVERHDDARSVKDAGVGHAPQRPVLREEDDGLARRPGEPDASPSEPGREDAQEKRRAGHHGR